MISLAHKLLIAKQRDYEAEARRQVRMADAARIIYSQIRDMHRELRRATRHYTAHFDEPEVMSLMNGINHGLNQIDLIYRSFASKGKVPQKVRRWWSKSEDIRRQMSEAHGDFRFSGPGY